MTSTGITSTKRAILQHLLKQGQASAQQLARSLSISTQAIRRHLQELTTEGLIQYHSVPKGMGRPQNLYQLSKAGREEFPQQYGEFAVSFLDALAETVGKQQVGEVLRRQWQKKADQYRLRLGDGSLEQRVTNLVQLRQDEGYMAELYVLDQPNQFILAEHNCAISEVAESYPSVCGHELEMFAAILPDCTVERTQWLNDGQHLCGYLIQPKRK
jgi:DeoR family suf operon transcriptional repressor